MFEKVSLKPVLSWIIYYGSQSYLSLFPHASKVITIFEHLSLHVYFLSHLCLHVIKIEQVELAFSLCRL